MYNFKIKTSFVSPDTQNVQAIKTDLNIMIVHFIFVKKLDIIRYDFSVWPRTGSNPVDINQFHT